MRDDDREEKPAEEETLDPPSWEELRALGHRMVDDMFGYLAGLRELPVWRPMPPHVVERFRTPLPQAPEGALKAYEDFRALILPYVTGNTHPCFWGWVSGNGTPLGALSEFLAGAINSSVDGFDDAGSHAEGQVLAWCKEMLGYPKEGSGILLSGSSMANFVGLAVARNSRTDVNLKTRGLVGGPRFTVYGSTHTHYSITKSVQLLGLGTEAFRGVPVDAEHRIDLGALEAALARDKAEGYVPLAIVGNAGTVAAGAIDDLEALAKVARREGAWYHVDGAFGACAALAPRLRPLLAGMEKADSLGFDLHKWMYLQYEAGCLLVRSEAEHRHAFRYDAAYIAKAMTRGLAAPSAVPSFMELGPQLSRGFRALKIWMAFKEHGIAKFGRIIEQNVEQAGYLAEKVKASPRLELLAPVPLNIVCFRYVGRRPKDGHPVNLDDLNRDLLGRLQESGVAVPSHAVLEGRFALRVAVANHRSRREDFDRLIEAVEELGARLRP